LGIIPILILDFDGIVCRYYQGKVLTISYNLASESASVSASPTYHADASFVKKLFVSEEGFIVIVSQDVMIDGSRGENLSIQKYRKEKVLLNGIISLLTNQTGSETWVVFLMEQPYLLLDSCGFNSLSRLLGLWQLIKTV